MDIPDDDALFVLTAVLLTPGRFPGVLGDDYPSACAGLGLDPVADGYGLVFGQDGTGARWTVAVTDAWLVACALAAWDCGLEYDLSPDERSVAASLPGWPVPVSVAVPGIPEPFDPAEESTGRRPLAPPDPAAWGPAQRRLGADEVALRWREWRDRFGSGAAGAGSAPRTEGAARAPGSVDGAASRQAAPVEPRRGGGTAAAPGPPAAAAREADGRPDAEARERPDGPAGQAGVPGAADSAAVPPAAPGISHAGVRRVLQAAEEYARTPPPPGRVRLAYGSVRADGPGWSLVGRADDMAFILLDDVPGEVLPVGRGPALPALMQALGRLASAAAGEPTAGDAVTAS